MLYFLRRIFPVSYTHLDVYKRQVLSGETGWSKFESTSKNKHTYRISTLSLKWSYFIKSLNFRSGFERKIIHLFRSTKFIWCTVMFQRQIARQKGESDILMVKCVHMIESQLLLLRIIQQIVQDSLRCTEFVMPY